MGSFHCRPDHHQYLRLDHHRLQTFKMQNVWSNLNFNTQSFQQNDNHSWSSYSNQSGPLGSNHGFYDSGPTSLPCFQTRLEVDTTPSCTWFEMSTNKKCFPKAREGPRQPSQPSSLTMFGQSWSA